MRSLLAVLLAFSLLAPESGAAQSGTPAAPAVGDSTPVVPAPAAKKKGMFGKMKGLAKNKIVKTVAKVALCTAVPGGQVIAGALDAAETKDVAGAATTAATGGGSCMPGMAGMAAPTGPGAAGIGAAGVGALGAGVPGAGLSGQPSTGMPGMTMSPEQMKQLQEQYGQMGMNGDQLRAMQQMMAGMPAAPGHQAAAATIPAAAAGTGVPPLTTEKGRLVLRQLPWTPGGETILPGSEPAFGLAMRDLAAAILATPARYKVEARVEEQGGKAKNRLLARKRAATVVAALQGQGIAPERLTESDGGADKDPRILMAETK